MAASSIAQIVDEAATVYLKLPRRFQVDINDWLEDRPHKVLSTKFDLLEAWLEWNGILGYDQDFRDWFNAIS